MGDRVGVKWELVCKSYLILFTVSKQAGWGKGV